MFIRPASSSSIYDLTDDCEPEMDDEWPPPPGQPVAASQADPSPSEPESPSADPNWWAVNTPFDYFEWLDEEVYFQ